MPKTLTASFRQSLCLKKIIKSDSFQERFDPCSDTCVDLVCRFVEFEGEKRDVQPVIFEELPEYYVFKLAVAE